MISFKIYGKDHNCSIRVKRESIALILAQRIADFSNNEVCVEKRVFHNGEDINFKWTTVFPEL